MTLLPVAGHAARRPLIFITPWAGVQLEGTTDYASFGGSGTVEASARRSWGGDVLLGVTTHQALWVSGGQREEHLGDGHTGWVTAGLAASTSRTDRVCQQFSVGAGAAWPKGRPSGWLIECRLGFAGRVYGPFAVELSLGAQREERRQLSTSDFFARGGIRFGPI
jgi:hypothetical protein